MLIYKMTNNINGKIYVGQTTRSLKERMDEHKRHSHVLIDREIDKYGLDNFSTEIIDHASTLEELDEKERKWIAFYNCIIPNGYNLCNGGSTTEGYHHTDEAKAKMSKTKKEKYIGEGNPFYGKHHSAEQKAKWSKDRKGCNMDKAREAMLKNWCKRVRNINTGKIFNSIKEAAEYYGIFATHITRSAKHGTVTHGCRWEYIK